MGEGMKGWQIGLIVVAVAIALWWYSQQGGGINANSSGAVNDGGKVGTDLSGIGYGSGSASSAPIPLMPPSNPPPSLDAPMVASRTGIGHFNGGIDAPAPPPALSAPISVTRTGRGHF